MANDSRQAHHVDCEAFGPDPLLVGFWIMLAAALIVVQLGDLALHSIRHNTALILVLCFALLCAVLVFSLRFRAIFSDNGFTYRRWGKTFSIPYSDIDHIAVTNRTLVTKDAVGAFVVTRNGDRYPFWPKLFPRRAIARFMAMAPVRG
jgi:hypothetical protein